jgi:signal transduction histidine kinase
MVPGFRVEVALANPDQYYARQRARTLVFGLLIALSAVTVLIGFVAAWRAFLRQKHLSEMKSNFVSSVSHELRAPIASVRLMAEELDDLDGSDREKSRGYHKFIVQECRRLSSLIENVLDFSRIEQNRKRFEFEPTDLSALTQAVVRLMEAYGAERKVGVRLVISGEPMPVELDGQALQQVLVNLLDNAIKHSPAQSTVVVGLEYPALMADNTAPQQTAETVRIYVEDSGEGIPAEDHERIFERFYRRGSELRRETQGVGLGLAIVKFITEAHGGKVTVRSALGQGSRFTIELPVNRPIQEKENP